MTARPASRLVLVSAATILLLAAAASGAGTFPKRIALPNGFQPEGIAIAGEQFFVGAIPTGAVYRGNLRTGKGAGLVRPRAGRAAIGIEADRGRLFVAGGDTGKAFVYDARNGRSLAAFTLANSGGTFVNDVAVTRNAAWFTDSFRPVLYRLSLGPGGRPAPQAVKVVPLTGDIAFQDGFNVNGIDATADGRTLVIVQSNTGRLFTVSPETGVSTAIDLGDGSVPNGDGILLSGLTLYVVQNQLSTVAKIALQPGLGSGSIVRRITDPQLDVPTTIDRLGSRLYAVNARFGTAPNSTTRYWVTRLPA